MIAMARVVRRLYGADTRTVFIGPCIAKKVEAQANAVAGDIDAVLTFGELRRMCDGEGIFPDSVEPRDFDPPHGGTGGLVPR